MHVVASGEHLSSVTARLDYDRVARLVSIGIQELQDVWMSFYDYMDQSLRPFPANERTGGLNSGHYQVAL
jgi:hypothetical protein